MEETNNTVEMLLAKLKDNHQDELDQETLDILIDELIFSLLF
jgi:hypothetical protein